MPGLPFPSRVHSPLDVSARVTVTKRRTVSALSGSLHRPPFRPFPPHPALRPATRGPYPLPAPRRDAIQPAAYCVFARRHIAARCYTRNGPLVGGDGALVGDKRGMRGGETASRGGDSGREGFTNAPSKLQPPAGHRNDIFCAIGVT